MSAQSDIETALVAMLDAAILELEATAGPLAPTAVEGAIRAASVRQVAGAANRLAYGQNEWIEQYAVTVWWPSTIDRADRLAEWDAFAAALLADQYLGDQVDGLEDASLSDVRWLETTDAHKVSIDATVITSRVE